MARGSRSTVRWKHDRIRKKRERDKRVMAVKAGERGKTAK